MADHRLVIVPDRLREAINAKLDVALKPWPEATSEDREHLFGLLLAHYDQTGCIPDFEVEKTLPQTVIKPNS